MYIVTYILLYYNEHVLFSKISLKKRGLLTVKIVNIKKTYISLVHNVLTQYCIVHTKVHPVGELINYINL